jgi:hypothetical protein
MEAARRSWPREKRLAQQSCNYSVGPRTRRIMESRWSIWLGIFIGSTIGGLIPELWDAGVFSYTSVLFSGIGALAGLWIGFKLGN